jgi:GNAT superfamily N-acetyltransferase
MEDEEFYDELYPLPHNVDVEAILIDEGTLQIGNFKVPEDNRHSGIGEATMEYIIQVAQEFNIDKIDVNIAYTAAPENATRKADPTTKFLRKLDFTVTPHKNTVSGIKRLKNQQE